MTFAITFLGATRGVTGSMYKISVNDHTVLLECGMFQGPQSSEDRNRNAFQFEVDSIDAVILSHAHIDHSGRIPLLVKRGYSGPIYTQNATISLANIMLPDSGYLHERDAAWQNKIRAGSDKPLVTPLYTRADAEGCLGQFIGKRYDEIFDVVPGLKVKFHDAGHILGAAIVELIYTDGATTRTVVFSGDIGTQSGPVMRKPAVVEHADVVLLESTYGDRMHASFADTLAELEWIFKIARESGGNILIPSFAVGRTQDLLFLLAQYRKEWRLADWQIFLDSPMAIEATRVYAKYKHLHGADFFKKDGAEPLIPNLKLTETTAESMEINEISSGAIIIAGSGMCTGGRILHHLKNNVSRPECHLAIVGFQAYGTLGRQLVDGAESIRIMGKNYAVRCFVHTIGGLSAHADQADLLRWYAGFSNRPPVYLIHGETKAQNVLAQRLREQFSIKPVIAEYEQHVQIH